MNREYCEKGLKYLVKQLESLYKAKDQTCRNPTINSVHRIRIASRRLKSSLQFYRKYIKKQHYKYFNNLFSNLMSKSGGIRDLDVLLIYLENELNSDISNKFKPGISRVHLRVEQRKSKLLKPLIAELEKIDSEKISKRITKIFDKKHLKKDTDKFNTKTAVIKDFIKFIEKCNETTNTYYSKVIEENEIFELHEYRKEVKKQRYTMEFYNSQYRFNLSEQIGRLKYYQELLGIIHDADIWIDFFDDFLIAEKKKTVKYFGSKSQMQEIIPGINHLITELKLNRNSHYKTFRENFINELGNDYWVNIYSLLLK